MPFNVTGRNAMLVGGLAAAITHVGIGTLADPGLGVNANEVEAVGGSYARLPVAWSGPSPGQIVNQSVLAFSLPAGMFGSFLFFNALTGNVDNYLGYAPINGSIVGFGTVDPALNLVRSSDHGLTVGSRVWVYPVLAETVPVGLPSGALYYVVAVTSDTFTLSSTVAGPAVDITGTGEIGFHNLIPQQLGAAGQFVVGAGQLTVVCPTI